MGKTGKKPLMLLGVIGIIIALNGLFGLISDVWLLKYGKMAAGVCMFVSYSRRSSNAVVQYEAGGRLYSINTDPDGLSKGSTAAVYYPPDDPANGRMIDLKDEMLSVLIGGAAALAGWKGKIRKGSGGRVSFGGITFSDESNRDK